MGQSNPCFDMELKEGYIGDYIGNDYRGYH